MPCPTQDNFVVLTLPIMSMTFVLSLSDPDVGISVRVRDVEHTSFILVFAAASFVCACLVNVPFSAPYVVSGSTQEL